MRATKNTRGQRSTTSSSKLKAQIFPCLLLLFSAAALFFFFFHQQMDFIWRTKTVAGHNLDPTPWHLFPPKTFKESTRYSLASRIFQCSYLTCFSSSFASQHQQQRRHAQALNSSSSSSATCPQLFQWIHQDLSPWRTSRISSSSIAEAQKLAAFRVVIVGGRLYADFYYDCVQSRAMFTIWGLLQLLRRYPSLLPDLDLMFDCMDRPTVSASAYSTSSTLPPPPLFRYCTTRDHFDIPFPDWSFWGWPEVNIGPWDEEFRSINLGSHALSWEGKHSNAYWKGNPDVASPIRTELLLCNDSRTWGAQIIRQNWAEEAIAGFEQSKLANQCNHKYKIYAEGYAWSVSFKYILSCGSLALVISPRYYDFFSRGLMPRVNYWPVSTTNLCQSIKFAVDWGNKHPSEGYCGVPLRARSAICCKEKLYYILEAFVDNLVANTDYYDGANTILKTTIDPRLKAESIGKGGQGFMQELNMDTVYDYMFHLLVEYAKLLDFKPSVPASARQVCDESLLCFADSRQKEFLERSSASSSPAIPCNLAPPDHRLIERWMQEKQEAISDIEKLETVWARESEQSKHH